MLTTHLHLVPRLRMNRAIPRFPLYTLMVWTWSSVDEICALRGYYTVNSGNSLKTFRDILSAPSSRVMNLFGFLIPEERKDLIYFAAEAGSHTRATVPLLITQILQGGTFLICTVIRQSLNTKFSFSLGYVRICPKMR
jgi:hypothetical protein